jgi:hypothetical protein
MEETNKEGNMLMITLKSIMAKMEGGRYLVKMNIGFGSLFRFT